MMAWVNWVVEPSRFEAIIKVAALLLALCAAWALIEIIRYVRSLRREKERSIELMERSAAAARPHEVPSAASPQRYPPPRDRRERGAAAAVIRQTVRVAGSLSLVLLLAAAAVVPFLGALLEYQDTPQRADYIVGIAGDPHVLQKTAELYQQGYSSRILIGRLRDAQTTATASSTTGSRSESEARNAPPAAPEQAPIPPSVTTSIGSDLASLADAAVAVREIVGDSRVKIILVTPRAQSWRAKMIFEDEMPKIRFIVALPEEGRIAIPWWNDRDTALLTVTETTKLLHYWVNSIRARPQRPPALRQENERSPADTQARIAR